MGERMDGMCPLHRVAFDKPIEKIAEKSGKTACVLLI